MCRMQSDYVSAFGLGALISSGTSNGGVLSTSRRSIRAIDADDDDDNDGLAMKPPTTTPNRRITPQIPSQQQQFSSKSSTMIAGGVSTQDRGTTNSNLKRNRFNSVETTPTTTNTSSSSTDTVTPLHGLAAKAATAVMRRSHSIKQAAQAKRKSALRSLSHTSAPHPHHDDQYELERLTIKYESFCNREDDNDDDDNEDGGRDADVEDAEDEADENESLLRHGQATVSDDKKDFNNNTAGGGLNTSDNNSVNNDLDGLKVIIVNNNSVVAASSTMLTPTTTMKSKRIDSIRMRHHSNVGVGSMNAAGGGGNQDAVSSSSSSSRLKKYFKCRKNKVRSKASQRRHNYLVIFLLFVVNLLNYIDRYTLAGMLTILFKTDTYKLVKDFSFDNLQIIIFPYNHKLTNFPYKNFWVSFHQTNP